MKPVLLTDFGSTYTKLTAVDLDAAKLLGTAQAYTTVASDVRIGFQKGAGRAACADGAIDICAVVCLLFGGRAACG